MKGREEIESEREFKVRDLVKHLPQNHEDSSPISRTCVEKPSVVRDYIGSV